MQGYDQLPNEALKKKSNFQTLKMSSVKTKQKKNKPMLPNNSVQKRD